ncbi:hypothetical protein [Leptolyngbya sp. FACHB-8]|uniref:hypothetical protein n=1 Tax=unclassified Leptolyngbya TaxID=2650499 RepID=UPI001683E4FC|nr:hypothetical protein [Leptolyngbya sp. FACHB-8]MBD1912902.1 hypothetical protein [Leptolyngbya sp. FACHB-8]
MNTCPCCSEPLLRHAQRGRIYWFCPHCHQEMPNLSTLILANSQAAVLTSADNSRPKPQVLSYAGL